MYCLELIKLDVSDYYVEVKNGALLCDIVRSWKIILGGHGWLWKSHGQFLGKIWEPCITHIA